VRNNDYVTKKVFRSDSKIHRIIDFETNYVQEDETGTPANLLRNAYLPGFDKIVFTCVIDSGAGSYEVQPLWYDAFLESWVRGITEGSSTTNEQYAYDSYGKPMRLAVIAMQGDEVANPDYDPEADPPDEDPEFIYPMVLKISVHGINYN